MTESKLNKVSTFHTKNFVNILAWDHLQPTSSCPLQPGQHGHHHHVTVTVMRRESGNIPCAALHWTPEWKGTWGQPKNTWCWTTTEAGPEQTEWGTFAVALHASRHNRHEWVSVFSLNEKISNLGPAVLTAPSLSQYSRVSASLRFCHKISSY